MGIALKKEVFSNIKKSILDVKRMTNTFIFSIEMDVPILDIMPAHGRNFDKKLYFWIETKWPISNNNQCYGHNSVKVNVFITNLRTGDFEFDQKFSVFFDFEFL